VQATLDLLDASSIDPPDGCVRRGGDRAQLLSAPSDMQPAIIQCFGLPPTEPLAFLLQNALTHASFNVILRIGAESQK
jgi:hypothetical protein